MIIAIEHIRHPNYGPITELHCPNASLPVVGASIRHLTGEHPVPVPLCACTSAYFVRGLLMEDACALLRMVLLDDYEAHEIDWELIRAEVALERLERKQFELDTLNNDCFHEEACADCRFIRFTQGDKRR